MANRRVAAGPAHRCDPGRYHRSAGPTGRCVPHRQHLCGAALQTTGATRRHRAVSSHCDEKPKRRDNSDPEFCEVSMKTISIDVKTQPVAKARPRLGRHGIYTPSPTIAAEKTVAVQVRNQWRQLGESAPWESGLEIAIEFRLQRPKSCTRRLYPSVRPDLDNYVKLVLDACNKILWVDDAQICRLLAIKRYRTKDESIGFSLTLTQLEDARQPTTRCRPAGLAQKVVASLFDGVSATVE